MKLEDLDIVTESETGFDIEPVPGVVIKTVGAYSRQARLSDIAYFRNLENAQDTMSPEEFAVQADIYSVHRAASRIAGWRGIDEPYSPELAQKLCSINPVIRLAVITESEKRENFTKSK